MLEDLGVVLALLALDCVRCAVGATSRSLVQQVLG